MQRNGMSPKIRTMCAEATNVRQAIDHLRCATEAVEDADVTVLVISLETEAASLARVIQRRYGAVLANGAGVEEVGEKEV